MKNLGSYFYKPKKRDEEITQKRWNIPGIIWRAITKTCTVIGAMILLSAAISTFLVLSAGGAGPKPLPNDMVLVFNLEDGVSEVKTHPTLLDPFPFSSPTLRTTINAIRQAKSDDRVRGIVFRLNGASLSIAHAEELRTALMEFKESGKFTKIYAPSYIDTSGGLTQYYLASAFDEIWMQPVGMFSISGPALEMPYAKNALDKLGVNPQFLTREEFKSAMANFTDAEMSEASKESLTSLVNDLSTQMLLRIMQDRKINMVMLSLEVDKGLLTGPEALESGLIDRLEHPDVLVDELHGKDKLIAMSRYIREPKPSAAKKNVALIYVTGTIVDESETKSSSSGSEISSYIKKAEEDKNIDAIILRVDSPGGSPSASETIRRAVVNAQKKGKKVVVSMGSVAASGGYWLSANADKIVASRGTITGSIGVVMGKFEASDLWEHVGVKWQGPQVGENADIWSMNKPFNEQQYERMNVLIDYTYDAFLERVAEGRGMEIEDVREVAKGRAWTGFQAQSKGLVDVLGGLEISKDIAAQLIGLNGAHDINLVRIPAQGSKFEQFLDLIGGQVSTNGLNIKENKLYKSFEPYVTQMDLYAKSPIAVYDASLESFR